MLPVGTLTDLVYLIFCRSCASCANCYEFIHVSDLLCLASIVSLKPSNIFGSCNLSILSSVMISGFESRGCDRDVLATVCYFLQLTNCVLYADCHVIQENDYLMRMRNALFYGDSY